MTYLTRFKDIDWSTISAFLFTNNIMIILLETILEL